MKISSREIAEALDKGGEATYNELSELVRCIKQIQEDWRDVNFVEVRVSSDKGNISSQLRAAFPKFHIWWEGDPGCCGENVVLVPGEMWSDSVKAELQKFDTWAGHHEETRRVWRLKPGIDIPADLRYELQYVGVKTYGKDGKPLPVEEYASKVELDHYAFRTSCMRKYQATHFDECEKVIREWDEPLVVHDRRKCHADFVSRYKQVIEI